MRQQFNIQRSTALVMAVALTMLAWTLPAGATSQTLRSHDIAVTYTYHGSPPLSRDSRLEISDNGRVVYDKAVTSKWCGSECSPNIIARARKVVHVLRLGRAGGLSVVLDLYTGGAHCCFVEQVYSLRASSNQVSKTEYNFGNPGVRLAKLGPSGNYDFVSADNAFAYAFTDYAASGMPLEIFSLSDGSFHNVTRSYPSLIRKDASQWMKAFQSQASSHYDDSVGVVAAWAADEDMLGHSSGVARFLNAQARAGHLNSALNPITPRDHKYVLALQKFLRRHGYLH